MADGCRFAPVAATNHPAPAPSRHRPRWAATVDDRLRREAHADTVDILICGSKNDHTVRDSLGRATSPTAVASYTYTHGRRLLHL